MEGFRVCPRCAARQRRSTILGVGFLVLLATVTLVAAGLGALKYASQGQFGPWWIYVVVCGSGLGLIVLSIFVWRQTQAANRRAANNVFFFQAEDGIRDGRVTGVQTCALPI